jgi:hypothetical protein
MGFLGHVRMSSLPSQIPCFFFSNCFRYYLGFKVERLEAIGRIDGTNKDCFFEIMGSIEFEDDSGRRLFSLLTVFEEREREREKWANEVALLPMGSPCRGYNQKKGGQVGGVVEGPRRQVTE